MFGLRARILGVHCAGTGRVGLGVLVVRGTEREREKKKDGMR